MDDEVDGQKWDAWNRVLAGLATQLSGSGGGKRDDGVLSRLYELAVEMRDKLKFSQGRLRTVKQELAMTAAGARSERHESLARLRELETEVARLAGAVHAQGSTLGARESVAQAQAVESEHLRRQVAALEQQLAHIEEDRVAAVKERNEALRHLDRMTQLLEESETAVVAAQTDHSGLLGELVATKGRLADLSALETLYGSARDELERLDKENLELKDMVTSGTAQLGRSRILEALGIPDSSDVFVSTRGAGAVRRSGGAKSRSRSAPRTRRASTAVVPYGRGAFVPEMIPVTADSYRTTARPYSARAVSPGRSPNPAASRRPSSMAMGAAPPLEDAVSEMAFLGPPSAAYPPDPENYVFYRVGGGYSPRLDPHQPTIPQPRASGWVPKDVVRLLQAFRHSYGLPLEWRFWEPLILMIDEVYRSRVDGSLSAMKSAQQEKLRTVKRQLRSALGYPSTVANGKITHLQRQLNSARKVLAVGDRKGDVALKQMAVKDYHLGSQLDRAVEENYALRRSLEELEELYTTAVSDGGAGAAGGRASTPGAPTFSPQGPSAGGASAASRRTEPYGSPHKAAANHYLANSSPVHPSFYSPQQVPYGTSGAQPYGSPVTATQYRANYLSAEDLGERGSEGGPYSRHTSMGSGMRPGEPTGGEMRYGSAAGPDPRYSGAGTEARYGSAAPPAPLGSPMQALSEHHSVRSLTPQGR